MLLKGKKDCRGQTKCFREKSGNHVTTQLTFLKAVFDLLTLPFRELSAFNGVFSRIVFQSPTSVRLATALVLRCITSLTLVSGETVREHN